MGADAIWVCHTCKTVCSRGGRPILQHHVGAGLLASSVDYYKEIVTKFSSNFEFDDHSRYVGFLGDLKVWLGRHESHTVHIGSDYSTDMMDLDDYHDETVDGKVGGMTRGEAALVSVSAFEESSIRKLSSIIQKHCCVEVGPARDAAKEIRGKFNIGDWDEG